MSIKVDFNADDFVEYMKNAEIACDNLEKTIAKYITKNKYKILKELVEEHNKLMGGDCKSEGMTK